MGPVAALIAIVGLSLLIMRIGAIALAKTGLSTQSSQFQAMSAFFGVGFTTREAEHVVNHPVRRKIISHLIFLGNIGVISGLGSVVLTFQAADDGQHISKAGLLLGAIVFFWLLTRFKPIVRLIDWSIASTLARTGRVIAVDYDHLLRIKEGYYVSDVMVEAGSALIGRRLAECRPRRDGVVLLGIVREDGEYIGVPDGETEVSLGDQLIVYGRDTDVRAFFDPQAVQSERDAI